jgi:Mrp family chromosome partitioning ATPase
MSSLDRAFFRAYAKEQPVMAAEPEPAAPAEGASPYVYVQSQRRPQLRYRIEPTHAPWGATPATEVREPIAVPDQDGHHLAADEAMSTPAWVSAGEAHLAEPAELPPPILPVPPKARQVAAPVEPPMPVAPADPFSGGIVCLPGMEAPESNYLATLVAADEVAEIVAPIAVQVAEPVTVAPAPVVEKLPEPSQQPEAVPTAAAVPPPAKQVENAPLAEITPPVVDRAALLAEESAAFWEVDRYLYPTITDRLLSRYEYFAHAGDKLKQAAQAGLKVLGITGVGRDEGRSTLAICLARAAARSGLKVVLIDCDFQRPRLAQHIGLDVATGWESVALDAVALAEVAIRSLEDGVTLLPLLDEAKTNTLSLTDDRVAKILAQARQNNDVVILDIGPLDAAAAHHASAATPLDAAIVVWDRRRRKLEEAEAVAKSLSAAGVEAVGIAENFAG